VPATVSSMHAWTDYRVIMHVDGDWQLMEGVLSKNMATVSEYLPTGKLTT